MKIEDYIIPESIEDRLALIERIWESMDADQLLPFSEAQKTELKARIEDWKRSPGESIPADQFFREVRQELSS